jgi:hypothetical protein
MSGRIVSTRATVTSRSGMAGGRGTGIDRAGSLGAGPWTEDHLRRRPRDGVQERHRRREEAGDQDQPVVAEVLRVRRQDVDRQAQFPQPAIHLEHEPEVVASKPCGCTSQAQAEA